MTICERCGSEIPEHVTVCPSCGTLQSEARTNAEPPADPPAPMQRQTKAISFDSLYEEYIPQSTPIIERNYAARPINEDDLSSQEASSRSQEKASSARFVNSNTPLMVEILLSLFMGIFGIGWLLIGETMIGVLLLIGSLLIYLPLLVISYALAFFSLGLSVLCTGPLALAAIFLNAFLLNNFIKCKRAFSATPE